MSVIQILVIILLVMLIVGTFPVWPHAVAWGYGPSGVLGFILLVILILVLMGKI